MTEKKTRVLMVEDNPGDVRLIEEMIKTAGANLYELVVVGTLDGALGRLRREAFDAVFLDLSLPDSSGLATMKSVQGNAPHVALVVITGLSDDTVALEALKIGAEDFLVKGNFDGYSLVRSLRYAIERKRAEEALRKSEENFRLSLDDSPLGVRIVTAEGDTIYANQAIVEIYGFDSIEELRGAPLKKLYTPESYAEFKIRKDERGQGEFGPSEYEISIVRKSGEVRDVQVFRKKIWWNGAGQFQTLYLDITERKQAEFQKEAALEKSRKSEARLREVLDNSLEVSYKLNLQTNHYDYLSPVIARISGYASDEIKSLPFEAIMDFIHPDDHAEMERVIGESMSGASGTGYQMNYRFKNKNGQYRWCQDRFTVMRDAGGHPLAIIGSVSDITDRKKAEEELRESEKKYRLLADNVDDVIFVLDMNLNYTYVSPSIKILRGYEPEEVMKQPSSKTLTPSSWDLITKTVAEAIELEKTEHREINISRTLQLEMKRKDGTTVWVEVKASFIRDENQRLIGIMGVTRDITERRQAEEKLLETLNRLTKAVGATIQVLVSAIECRDPYTAGHQLRVADLARTIATEMGLPKDTIEGIRMAGSIHDIGKLSIPAEILSKPTKLTKIEFSLIKEHAEIGYEMLKNVESPWPLAQIVYQHHERMDGSGYPRNLKGNEILLEARIMAVADVVEAMASHRPYRPALGIDAALEEIEKNRGTLYDDAVADACLRLFREKGYKLIV